MSDFFGTISPPENLKYSPEPSGLVSLLNNILRLAIVVGGVYALLNFIIAGYQFMSSNGDPKLINLAWAKIWQSLVGLLIIVGSFALAGLLGYILFKDPMFILKPKVYGP